MAEDRDPRFEPGLALDQPGQRIADAALGELHVAERIGFRGGAGLVLELRDVSTFRDDDDAEELALATPAVKMADDVAEGQRELGDDDQVGAAGDPAV